MQALRLSKGLISMVLTGMAAFGLPPARAQEVPPAAQAGQAQAVGQIVTLPSGLRYTDTRIGDGATPRPGALCFVNYTGWLYENGVKGQKFDSSFDRGRPFSFLLSRHMVIKGWDEGVATMKVGGKRTLIIPPELAYGSGGAGGVIPPNATLIFDIELVSVKGS